MPNKLRRIKSIILALFALSAISCGTSDKEIENRRYCMESAKYLDAYDEDGTHFSKTYSGKRAVREICKVKANLYTQGYRIKRHIHLDDIRLYQIHLASDKSLRSWYIRGIKDGMVL